MQTSNFKIKNFLPVMSNKYFIAGFAFIIWVSFFDMNNLVERFRLNKELKQIEKDKVYYHQRIDEDAARLKELQTNDQNLEKFAREQYLMKRDDEDVFIIVHQ